MLHEMFSDYMYQVSEYLPVLSSVSPVTMIGLGIVALGSLLYLFTRVPEYLLVVVTALLYAAAPLLR
jgi:hypothetical protein